jgi:RNA polymerase subunit RPABC4/transcription elongation factor Spt4
MKMGKLVLEIDEVVLLEESELEYSGSIANLDFVDKLVLTNKRIISQWTAKREDKRLDIYFDIIKKYNDELQVDCYNDDNYGECLRLQTVNGIELYAIQDDIDKSIVSITKSVFSTKKKVNKRIALWIDKINEAAIGKMPIKISTAEQRTVVAPIAAMPNKESDIEMNLCRECGKKIDRSSLFCPSCGAHVVKPKVVEVQKIVVVVCCRKCGTKMEAGTKFCPSCGTSVIEEPKQTLVPPVIDDKKAKDRKVSKCSNCGEILRSDSLTCPSCGNEIRGREAVLSVQEFFEKISSIENESKKIESIKMYPIPNNKEDINEFMFLACSIFDAKKYEINKQDESIASAWLIKINQCYKKSKMMFTDAADIQKIEKMYKEVQVEIQSTKQKKSKMTTVGTALIIISFLMVGLGPIGEDGSVSSSPLSTVASVMLIIGIIILVKGLKKKKNNKQ